MLHFSIASIVDAEHAYYMDSRSQSLGGHRSKAAPPLGHRERSTSAPNVCLINTSDAAGVEVCRRHSEKVLAVCCFCNAIVEILVFVFIFSILGP